jgi:hypothetical protein
MAICGNPTSVELKANPCPCLHTESDGQAENTISFLNGADAEH